MNKTEGTMEKLQRRVEEAKERFEKDGNFDLVEYVTRIVIPALKNALQDLCCKIEGRHKLGEDGKKKFVIHYTSINTLVSMLENASINKEATSLRLYDSVHLNDPDEGSYFYRNLNLPKKHNWIEKKKESHAYIASFIILDDKRDMGNNLIFWRTYGKEGEGCSLKLDIPSCRLRKVLYGASKVKCTGQTLRPVLDALYPLVNIRDRSIKQKIQKKLKEAVWESLERICYLYKSEAYNYEHECRFIIPKLDADKDKICFEPKEQNNYPEVRHYHEHEDLKVKNILTTGSLIMIGPCVPYPYNMSYYLKNLLNKAGLLGPKIRTSKIPYRKP